MSTHAVLLSGGVGTRMGANCPKQYLLVKDKPVILYSLERFQACDFVDSIVIVANPEWFDKINEWCLKGGITKIVGFARAGDSRQASVLSGLLYCARDGVDVDDVVIVHDAARPLVSVDLLERTIKGLECHDACMPAIPVKDTIYYSDNGESVSSLLDRDKLFSGQSPEAFRLSSYLDAHTGSSDGEIAQIRGSSEMAFNHGLDVSIVQGEETNFKITTPDDLARFQLLVEAVER